MLWLQSYVKILIGKRSYLGARGEKINRKARKGFRKGRRDFFVIRSRSITTMEHYGWLKGKLSLSFVFLCTLCALGGSVIFHASI